MMKTKTITVLVMAFIFVSAGLVFPDSTQVKGKPLPGKILLIVGQDNKTIDAYIESTGIVPGGFMGYTSIQKMEGLNSPSPDYGSGIFYADELIQKYPNTVLQIGLYMVDGLESTYQGVYDDNIKILADWLKKINIPVFLRIGYECEGMHNHYDPENYKKAYCYLVDKLKAAGIGNAVYVWHLHAHRTDTNLDLWYPGKDYVDWVGISYFAQDPKAMEHVVNFARKENKPVMIAESTPLGVGTIWGEMSWKRWFERFFQLIDEYDIKAVSYINSNWEEQSMWKDQGWGDARIQANSYIKEQWLKEISKDKYLKSSKDLFRNLGFAN
ncbi:MAG: glycosyl hydrolase [Candidatus Omnitrophota bacterium]